VPSDLVIRIRADDGNARGVLKGVSGAVEDVGKSALSPSKVLGGLTDVMGKVGLAALGVQAAVGAATGIVSGLVGPAVEAQQVTAQLQAVLASTGGAAGVTQGAVEGLSQSLSRVTTFEDEAITSAQSLLLTFCLEESAEALTKDRGWVRHDALAAGDEILAYDPETGGICWEPVESMHRFNVDGDLIRWRSKQIDVATTPHHRWWASGGAGMGEPFRFRTTAEISGRHIKVMIGGGRPGGFAGRETIDNDMVELLGWVATEGWFMRNTASPKYVGVGLSQSQTHNPDHVTRIRGLVGRLVERGHRISETQYKAPYNGSVLSEWHFAGALGQTVRSLLPDKKLTPWLLGLLTEGQGQLLLETLLRGDGHTDQHGGRQYIQKDPGQLDVVAMLCAMLGIRTSVLGRGGDRDSLYLCKTNYAQGVHLNAKAERYQGVVWCPHLRTGIFMARCNGRTFWTGNTNIGKDVFPAATETVLDMSQALGQDLKTSSVQLGKALNDPIKGITALSRVGVSFTDEQKDMIRTMVEAGDVAGAQAVILGELQKEFGGAARAAGETFAGQLTILQNELGNVVETIGGPVVSVLTELLRELLPLVQAFGEWLPGALEQFLVAMEPVARFVTEGVIPTLKELGEVVTLIFAGDFQAAVDLLSSSILPRIQEFGAAVLGWIGEQVPVLVERLGQWAQEFLAWVGPAIPPLLAELATLAGNLLTWIGEQLPGLATAFSEWALQAIQWVLDALPGLIDNLGALLNTIIDWLRAHAPGLIEAFIAEFVPAAIVWVARAAVEIVTHLPGILLAIGRWVVQDGVPGLHALGNDLGQAIVRGLAGGIRNLAGTVASEARAVAQRAIDAARSLLQTDSPSRVFEAIGEDIDRGLIVGMANLHQRVSEAARAMTQQVIPPAEDTRDTFISLAQDGMGLATSGARNLAEALSPIGGVLSGLSGSVDQYASALRNVPTTVSTSLAIQGQSTPLGSVSGGGGQPSSAPQGGNPGDPPEVRAAGGWGAYNAQHQGAPRNPDGTVKKQWGGRLWAGQAAIVGEGGPELIVARQHVEVLPNHTLRGMGGGFGGGGGIDYERLAAAVAAALSSALPRVPLAVGINEVHGALLRHQRGLSSLGFR
jgi:hypothetical protein